MLSKMYVKRGMTLSLIGLTSFLASTAAFAGLCAPGEAVVGGAVICQDYIACRWEDSGSPYWPDKCLCDERKEQYYSCVTPPPNSQVTASGIMEITSHGVMVDDSYCDGISHGY
jgi:hypothetical protein